MIYKAVVDEREMSIDFDVDAEKPVAIHDGRRFAVEIISLAQNHLLIRLDGKVYTVLLTSETNGHAVNVNGKLAHVQIEEARLQQLRQYSGAQSLKSGTREVKAPMPGLVLRILVNDGDKIRKNDGLLVIEAMKMENEIRAADDGVVQQILVQEKQAVDKDALLMRLK